MCSKKAEDIIDKGISDAMRNYYGPWKQINASEIKLKNGQSLSNVTKKNWVEVVDMDTFMAKMNHRKIK